MDWPSARPGPAELLVSFVPTTSGLSTLSTFSREGVDMVEGDAPLAGEVATDNTAEMRAGKMSGRGFHRRASRCRCATSGTSGGPGAGGSCRGGVAGAEMAGTEAAVAFRVCRGARPGGGWVGAARSRGSRVCARTSRLLPY